MQWRVQTCRVNAKFCTLQTGPAPMTQWGTCLACGESRFRFLLVTKFEISKFLADLISPTFYNHVKFKLAVSKCLRWTARLNKILSVAD